MKKRIAVWSVLLALSLSLFAPAAFAEEEPAWSAAYREFILNKGFASSGQEFGYEAVGGMPNYEYVKFGLYDLGSDGVPELIAYRGANSRAGMVKYVYAFEDGAVRFLDHFGAYEGTSFMRRAPFTAGCLTGGCSRDAAMSTISPMKTGNLIRISFMSLKWGASQRPSPIMSIRK